MTPDKQISMTPRRRLAAAADQRTRLPAQPQSVALHAVLAVACGSRLALAALVMVIMVAVIY